MKPGNKTVRRTNEQVVDDDCDIVPCLSRRTLIKAIAGSAVISSFSYADIVYGATGEARLEDDVYPQLHIAKVGELEEGVPKAFAYPLKQQPNMIIKLGKEALHGVGPDRDIVAFSSLCTHMGGSLRGRYRHDTKAIGPCPFHFSSFDLRKGGIPVHASATQNLPQIVLRAVGDDLFAIGVIGLIYGYRNNLADGEPVDGSVPGGAGGRWIMRT